MIDATFISRAAHFVPLSLLRHIADSASPDPPEEIAYIGTDGVKAIKGMYRELWILVNCPKVPYDILPNSNALGHTWTSECPVGQ